MAWIFWIELFNSGGAKEYKQKAACILQQNYPRLRGVIPWMVHPSTPIFEVINPPCNAIFKSQSTFSTKSKENKHS